MHLLMILVAIAIACGIRNSFINTKSTWYERWHTALTRFLFPPLLLLSTAIALVCMGSQGKMMGLPVGELSYVTGLLVCLYSLGLGIILWWQGWQTIAQISHLPQQEHGQDFNQKFKIWESDSIFAAQIGFWQPQLVVSSGMIQQFDPIHLEAVIKHEQAHLVYRDTFWFFILGYFRQLTPWLPQTEILWQELLLLRELRADRWAVQSVEPLVLAESLLWAVGGMSVFAPTVAATLSQFSDRLEERIETLLTETGEDYPLVSSKFNWGWIILAASPFILICFHS
ncbi:Zn-dependent protease with chaperone function [Synechococcus sp. PCC 7502]|uniref:M56 family metallopeptidase n=1 Tax=Synechococcus sp. PCC 7502 TaxID=1173263 RepID=UPI00029FF6F1|nr:M56 family metallopeptidase [Synechococcus sp. PCC 7502]AFY75353.1 Zn-dependent protease with chaperone function [Synechococcus sp. PCC 7502]